MVCNQPILISIYSIIFHNIYYANNNDSAGTSTRTGTTTRVRSSIARRSLRAPRTEQLTVHMSWNRRAAALFGRPRLPSWRYPMSKVKTLGARHEPAPQLDTPTDLSIDAVRDVSRALNGLLADAFALYVKTKNFHWHVSGPHFRDYHLLLDEQAEQIFATTDEIAERVRKIGGATLRSIGDIAKHQTIKDNDAAFVAPNDMLRELMADNKAVAHAMRKAHDLGRQARGCRNGQPARELSWTQPSGARGSCSKPAAIRTLPGTDTSRRRRRSFSDLVSACNSHCRCLRCIAASCSTSPRDTKLFDGATQPWTGWCSWPSRPPGSTAVPCALRARRSHAMSASIQARPRRNVPAIGRVCAADRRRLRSVRRGRAPRQPSNGPWP